MRKSLFARLAAWAARSGRDVLVIDSAQFPRDKACGDGLTPRAIAEMQLLGLGPWLEGRIAHRGPSRDLAADETLLERYLGVRAEAQ